MVRPSHEDLGKGGNTGAAIGSAGGHDWHRNLPGIAGVRIYFWPNHTRGRWRVGGGTLADSKRF